MSLPVHLEILRDEALRTSCESWAIRSRWKLSPGIDRAGPCPSCGGNDRFSIHTKKNLFNCRRCGITGEGVIDLVMKTQDVDFTRACEIITGRSASEPVDEAKAEGLRQRVAAEAEKRQTENDRYREEARRRAYGIWSRAAPVTIGGPVDRYLKLRGIDLDQVITRDQHLVSIFESTALPWREQRGNTAVTVHSGPAMIAAVTRPDGKFGAVHQTWLDLEQPKGKLILPVDEAGKDRPSKKVLGAKKGGAIRLHTPYTAFGRGPRRVVMGEGIETTLTAMAYAYEDDTAYWAGVDLGNMSGRAARSESGGILHDAPDLDDRDCFMPPDWCEELVYLCDSDEAANHTEEKIIRGLRRAVLLRAEAQKTNGALLPLVVGYVPPLGDGKDLNDLVRVG